MARPRKNRLEEVFPFGRKRADREKRLMTAVTFSAEELAALAEYIAAGLVLLRISSPHRAVSKIKAALSRVKVSTPRSL